MERRQTKIYVPLTHRVSLREFTQTKLERVKNSINAKTQEQILTVSPTTYIDSIIQEYAVDTPSVDFDMEKTLMEDGQLVVSPNDLFAEPALTFTYHLPFSGDYHTLVYLFDATRKLDQEQNSFFQYYIQEPNFFKISSLPEKTYVSVFIETYQYYKYWGNTDWMTREQLESELQSVKNLSSPKYITNSLERQRKEAEEIEKALEDADTLCRPYIHLEIITTKKKMSAITADLRAIFREFKRLMQNVSHEMDLHNKEVKQAAEKLFYSRKRMHEKQNSILQALRFPVKKRKDIPLTFTVPTERIRKQLKLQQPVVEEKGYHPEPTLDENIYLDILRTIYEVGKAMARLPSISRNRYEEDLRDLFLIYLAPRYDAAVSGETFNRTGKTDILIRWYNSNVFVAECKVWHGTKAYMEGLDQLLANVEYRDTKAAFILFVKKEAQNNEEALSTILPKVRDATAAHMNCLRLLRTETDTWFTYRFHVNNDPDKEVHLAVIIIWIPWE